MNGQQVTRVPLGASGQEYPGECPEVASPAVMTQDWAFLSFLHWRYDADTVQSLLPRGLEVDLFDGSAWVGLVPFAMRIKVGPLPPLPYATIFPETNVRTYVHGPDGRAGVWFFSLDVPRLAAALGARATYGLPYMWSDMAVDRGATQVTYRLWRHWKAWPPTTSRVTVEVGEAIEEHSELEHFLTARWRLFNHVAGSLWTATVEHRPWPLRQARAIDIVDSLVPATGLPAPQGEPLVHYSPGVQARIGILRPVQR